VGLALDLDDYHPSVLLHCWLGHLTCKIVSEMTYNVSSGTLNPTIPYHTIQIYCLFRQWKVLKSVSIWWTYGEKLIIFIYQKTIACS